MMMGGAAFLYPIKVTKNKQKILELLGASMILTSYLLITTESQWPGYLALLPVLGTYLVIQAQSNNSFITGNFLFQKIGTWSYSIYLWHWPIVVGIYFFSLSTIYILFGIILSVILGFISNKYIEKIKFQKDLNIINFLRYKPMHMVLIVGGISSIIYINKGIESRFTTTTAYNNIKNELVMPLRSNGYCFYSFKHGYKTLEKEVTPSCSLGKKGTVSTTLLFGDSFAGHNEPFYDEIFKDNGASLTSLVTNWCIPSLTKNFTGPLSHIAYKQCLLNRSFLKQNMHKYKNIIYAGAWDRALEKGQISDVESLIVISSKTSANIFIMAGPPRFKKNPLLYFYKNIYLNNPFNINTIDTDDTLMTEANSRLEQLSQSIENVHFIDRSLIYSDENTFELDGLTIPYTLDGGHISILGSKNSAKYFMEQEKYNEIMKYFSL